MTDKVLDFISKRKENIEDKRQNLERILFQNFLGAYSVIDKGGVIYPIQLVDISHDGCLFQVPWNVKTDEKFSEGFEVPLRVYFTKGTYIPVICNVKYSREFVERDGQTYMQYGCEFDKSMHSFEALESFIDFLYKYSEHSALDKGDHKVYFL